MATKRGLILRVTDLPQVRDTIKKVENRHNRIKASHKFLRAVGQEIGRQYFDPAIRTLRKYPPNSNRRRIPLRFVSDKQRRYVMGVVLKGKPYKRTHRLGRAWTYHTNVRNNTLYMAFENKVPYRKFVMGNFGMGRSRRQQRRYLKPMQPFHHDRGWQPAYKITQVAVGDARTYAHKRYQQWLKEDIFTDD